MVGPWPPVLVIQLKRFQPVEGMGCAKSHQRVIVPEILEASRHFGGNGDASYRLKSMVVHDGGIGGGHNMAYVRDGGMWYWFSDEHFAVVSQAEVDRAEPYLLFYERKLGGNGGSK